MSPKYFFYTEDQPGTSNLESRTGGEAITVMPNFPGKPDRQEVFLGISMDWSSAKPGEAWAAVDADELRDAIDKAVGKREAEGNGTKVYPARHRDRHLRHIEDLEATLTRRNGRHERDQERIRELEARIKELETEVAAPSLEGPLDALEKVGADQEVVLDPPRLLNTPSAAAKCIPAIEVERITSHVDGAGEQGFRLYAVDGDFGWFGKAEQVLELGIAAGDFAQSARAKRKEYESKGLAEWEVQLLMEAGGKR